MKNILPQNAWDLLKTEPNSLLIDVRRPDEWNSVGCPNLTSIQKNLIKITWTGNEEEFINELLQDIPNKDCHVIFICRGGTRSTATANLAFSHGYQNSYNLIGGFEKNGWKDNGLPCDENYLQL